MTHWAVILMLELAAMCSLCYYLGYKRGARRGRQSPFAPDSTCAACGRPEREHNSCPPYVAQKSEE